MPYYEDEVTEVRLPAGVRANRAKRRKQRRHRRIATVAVLGLAAVALVVVPAARSWAWTAAVQPSTDCTGTTFNGTVGNEPGSHTAQVTFAGQTKSVTVPAEGGNSFTLQFASHDGGAWSYEGTWSESSEVETASGTLPAATGCEPTTTTSPPTTAPPVTAPVPPDDTPKLGPPDQHRTPPIKKAPPKLTDLPPVKQPGAGTGQLPFTGPSRWLLPAGLVLVLTGALMVLGGRRRYQQLSLVEKAVDRAMHGKPYDGPHEPV